MLAQGFSGSGRLGWSDSHDFRLPISATDCRYRAGGQPLEVDAKKLAMRAVPAAHYQRLGIWERLILGYLRAELRLSPLLLGPTLLAPGPEFILKLRDRAPPFDLMPLSLSRRTTRVRRSHGTRRFSLTVASVRTWRGWQVYAAWDPAFNIIHPGYRPMNRTGGRNSTPL